MHDARKEDSGEYRCIASVGTVDSDPYRVFVNVVGEERGAGGEGTKGSGTEGDRERKEGIEEEASVDM